MCSFIVLQIMQMDKCLAMIENYAFAYVTVNKGDVQAEVISLEMNI